MNKLPLPAFSEIFKDKKKLDEVIKCAQDCSDDLKKGFASVFATPSLQEAIKNLQKAPEERKFLNTSENYDSKNSL